jgi:hypothetical protein
MYDATALAQLVDDDSIELPSGASSLAFLQAIYRSKEQPMMRRMKAAIAALPYEHPKLAVTAVLDSRDSFAAQLEGAIARSRKVLELHAAELAPPLPNGHAVYDSAAEVLAPPSARTGMVSYRRR